MVYKYDHGHHSSFSYSQEIKNNTLTILIFSKRKIGKLSVPSIPTLSYFNLPCPVLHNMLAIIIYQFEQRKPIKNSLKGKTNKYSNLIGWMAVITVRRRRRKGWRRGEGGFNKETYIITVIGLLSYYQTRVKTCGRLTWTAHEVNKWHLGFFCFHCEEVIFSLRY